MSWFICFILTVTDVFTNQPGEWGYEARTDIRLDVLRDVAWFRIPYPGTMNFDSFAFIIYRCKDMYVFM